MKISFLLISVDHLAGTERAAVTQANALADRHTVEIISLQRLSMEERADLDPRVKLRYVTSPSDIRGVDLKVADAAALAAQPSRIVPPWWDPTFDGLCDVAIQHALPRTKADVIVTMTPGLLAAATQYAPADTAIVHQEHRSSMHRTAGRWPLLAFGVRADAVVSLTEANAGWLRENLGRLAPPVYTVPNAAPAPGQPQSLLDQPVIMAAGRLDGEKQHEHLVRAFASIADQLPEWRLRIYGTGDRRPALMNTIRQTGLYDRVEFPGASRDLAAEWAGASISALVSSREGFPLVLLEAFAAGLPVVAYDCPTGPSELIEDGVNGLLVPQDDEEALARQLLRLAQDHELRARLGGAARESLARFDEATVMEQWEQIYAAAVTRRRAGVPPLPQQPAAPEAVEEAPKEMLPRDARRTILATLAAFLPQLPGAFVMPPRLGAAPVVAVPGSERDRVLDLLRASGLPSWTVLRVDEEDHWHPGQGSVDTMTGELRKALTRGFTLTPATGPETAPGLLAHGADVRVEFWSAGTDGTLHAPHRNSFADLVHPDDLGPVEICGVEVPGLAALPGPFADEPAFPIDVVYTWVDDSDPVWQQARRERQQAAGDTGQDRRAAGDARFRNRDELRYSLRSIHAFAPWVNKIYLVTAGQRPAWLLDDDRVQVVDHREILPPDALPTFNSHAIEAALHRIPGLSEHFVYMNDDVFLGHPVGPELFFTSGGLQSVFASPGLVGIDGRDDRPFILAGVNNRRLIRERFGATTTQLMLHTPHPHRRSVLEAVAKEFAPEVEATQRAPFRSPTDVSVTASLAQHYALLNGDGLLGQIASRYVSVGAPGFRHGFTQLLARTNDVFCLGDWHDTFLPQEEVSRELQQFLDTYLPVAAPWEA